MYNAKIITLAAITFLLLSAYGVDSYAITAELNMTPSPYDPAGFVGTDYASGDARLSLIITPLLFCVFGLIFGALVRRNRLSPYVSRKLVSMSAFTFLYYIFTSGALPITAKKWCYGWKKVTHLDGVSSQLVLVRPACDFTLPQYELLFPGVAGLIGILLLLFALGEPFRKRFRPLETIYLSISRPEDEPYTLRWIATELITVSTIISVFFFFVDRSYDMRWLVMVPVFAAAFGDGLSEIIGYKFGTHRYKVFSLAKGRTYYRSLEGSAAIFLCASLVCLMMYHLQHAGPSYLLAYCLLPFAITLAEAKSPHSWDNPFIYLASYAVIALTAL